MVSLHYPQVYDPGIQHEPCAIVHMITRAHLHTIISSFAASHVSQSNSKTLPYVMWCAQIHKRTYAHDHTRTRSHYHLCITELVHNGYRKKLDGVPNFFQSLFT